MSVLFQAHRQWRERPADERYASLKDLHEVTLARRQQSVPSRVRVNELRFTALGNDVAVQGANTTVMPTHWAMSQLCDYADAPSGFIRKLPATLAAENLNWCVQNAPREEMVMLWANHDTPGTIRCFTTPKYGRLWDSDVVEWLRRVTDDETNGWHRPPSYKDSKMPSGIYGGDRNIFCFLVNESNKIDDGKQGLSRGFFCWNSEVRQMSFGFSAFLYVHVCGNHLVWGAQELFSVRMAHLGGNFTVKAAGEFQRLLDNYLNAPPMEEAAVKAAKQKVIARDAVDAAQFLYDGRARARFKQNEAVEIVRQAESDGDDPTILWSLIMAATAFSQKRYMYQDERASFDRSASAMLDLALR